MTPNSPGKRFLSYKIYPFLYLLSGICIHFLGGEGRNFLLGGFYMVIIFHGEGGFHGGTFQGKLYTW
jgi:hypothetical protein